MNYFIFRNQISLFFKANLHSRLIKAESTKRQLEEMFRSLQQNLTLQTKRIEDLDNENKALKSDGSNLFIKLKILLL